MSADVAPWSLGKQTLPVARTQAAFFASPAHYEGGPVNKLKDFLKQLAEVDAKIDTVLSGDTLTDQQTDEYKTLSAQRDKIQAAVQVERTRLLREEERAKLSEDAERIERERQSREERDKRTREAKPGDNRLTDPDSPRAGGDPAPSRTATPEPFVIPATVKQRGSVRNFQGVRNGLSAEQRACRFGMWAMNVLGRQLPSKYAHLKSATDPFIAKYMTVVTSKDATGHQYLIPEEFSRDIIDLREMYGVARRLLRFEPMASDTKVIPRRQGGLTAYFVGEAQPGTASNKLWDQVRLVARKLMALSVVSNEVDADLMIDWGDDIAREIAYAFAVKEDECAFNGDGTSTYGGIQGIRSKLDNVDGAGTDSAGLITQGTGNTWAALVLADFYALLGATPRYAMTDRTAWVCSNAFYYNVMLKLTLATQGTSANEIVTPPGRNGPRPMFLGHAVEISQSYPGTTAVATVACTFGDHSMAAIFGDRGGEEIEFSTEATVGADKLWEQDLLGVRGKERFDIVVHDVGSASAAGPVVGLKTGA